MAFGSAWLVLGPCMCAAVHGAKRRLISCQLGIRAVQRCSSLCIMVPTLHRDGATLKVLGLAQGGFEVYCSVLCSLATCRLAVVVALAGRLGA
jgi:hypothetical protein